MRCGLRIAARDLNDGEECFVGPIPKEQAALAAPPPPPPRKKKKSTRPAVSGSISIAK